MAIENVTVTKGEPATSPDQGVRNVERETWTDRFRNSRADARREKRAVKPLTTEQKARQFARVKRLLPGSRQLLRSAKGATEVTKDLIKASAAAWALILGTLWNIVLLQFIAGILYLIGLAAVIVSEETWWDYADFADIISSGMALPLFFSGLALSLLCGILLLLAGILIFTLRGVSVVTSWSIPMMVICLVMHAIPGISLLPGMYLWYLYVVKTQVVGK